MTDGVVVLFAIRERICSWTRMFFSVLLDGRHLGLLKDGMGGLVKTADGKSGKVMLSTACHWRWLHDILLPTPIIEEDSKLLNPLSPSN